MASTSLHNFQPKVVFIKRKSNQGFGFTLRHFIAYPPEIWNSPDMPQIKAMETIFIKEVHLNGPAYLAGLQTGDRLLTVNDEPIAGVPYSVIVSRIKQTPYILKLEVVSKECDVLQMYYTDIAHNPESNRFRDKNKLALLNYVPSSSNSSGSSNLNAINRKTLSFPTTTIPLATAFNNVNLQQQQQPAMIQQQQQQQQPNQLTKLSSNTNFFPETRAKLKFSEKFSAFGESNFNFSTIPSTTTTTFSGSNNSNSNSCDFMARLRKSIEQKEEFLNKVSAPQNYTNSFFKTFKSSDNPKRMISSGDKVNNIYALTSMGFSQNPKGEDDEDNDKRFQLIAGGGGGGIEKGEIGAVALPLPAPPKVITSTTIKDVHYDEQNLYGGIKKDGKLNKVTERYKPVSPITLGIPPNEPISLCKIPTSVFDKCERKLEMKTTNMQNKSIVKVGTLETSEKSNSLEYKENDLDSMKSEDCITSLQNPSQVLRRCRASTLNDDNKLMRRISYLRATNNEDGFHIETNHPELMNFEEKLEICDKENECKAINDLQSNAITSTKSENNTESITSEMEIKSSSIFGKRLTEYRSWKHVKIELKGETLKIITGRNKSDTNIIELNLKNYEISEDISSRRKYVFKLQSITNAQKINIKTNTNDIQQQQQIKSDCSSSSNSTANNNIQFTEIYFKVENLNEMKKWIELIKSRITSKKDTTTSSQSSSENNGKQLAEPQKTAAISSVSTSEYPDDTSNEFKKSLTISPISICSTTTNTVTTITESKDNETDTSNSVCSPVIKTRKSEKSDKDLGSPKSKNWRDLLFRKGGSSGGGGGSSGSGSSSGSSLQMGGACRTGGSIGFPLKSCPMSKDNEYVPCIVDVCTKIVESKGLNVVGIYRIPGNKAAISELKDQVNRNDFQWDQINDDIRWDDVNVVSSLLKLFIRSLPDGLLPCTFYINFIESDKCNKGEKKLKEIKYLLNQLPVYSYETLKHIIQHLHRISKNCDVNLMEPKNLAIIFGPSIIRTPNETLEIAVKDMKHQCCIVELLVSQYEYFFESGAFPTLENNSSSIATSITTQHQQEQQTLLLGNVQKIERKYHTDKDKESVASRFIPHLRRRSQSKRSTINSDTYSGESILSLECKKLNNDQCENSEHGSKEEGGSLEISISLTDEESSNSRISDSGSMSLTTITDTLDSKLRNLRSTSESQSQSDENDSPNKQQQQQQQQQIQKNNTPRRDTSNTQQQQIQQQSQPLILHENIPFVDDSPEIPSTSIISDNNCSSSISNTKNVKCSTSIGTNDNVFVRTTSSNLYNNSSNRDNLLSKNHSSHHHHQQHHHHNHHSSTISKLSSSSNLHNYSHKFIGSGKGGGISCSSDDSDHDDSDSEVSTTSDPKESILISPLIFEQRYKKRNNNNNKNNSNGNGSSSSGTNGNYNKLFRSASFNCRNYSATNKYGNNTSTPTTSATTTTNQIPITSTISSNLTKDEKTDMNYTKKRQIQNKQNRSIKRRHTVGGPSDYSATITRRTDNDHVLEVGIRIKNLNRRKNMN